jgi:hypothetical protein
MLAYQEKSGAHAGEDQASRALAVQLAHWQKAELGLLAHPTAARLYPFAAPAVIGGAA